VELTLTAICLALIALATAAAIALSRGRSEARDANIRAIAQERGLGDIEIRQLEHLSRLLSCSSIVELLLSPRRFNVASACYLDSLRASNPTEAQYFGLILELTRLRRRIHPPKSLVRRLDTTRELSEGISVSITYAEGRLSGFLWAVNEDHLDIRLQAATPDLVTGENLTCRIDGTLATAYDFETNVRSITDAHRGIIRIEHAHTVNFIRLDTFDDEPSTPSYIRHRKSKMLRAEAAI
jgi:hypothetical protein